MASNADNNTTGDWGSVLERHRDYLSSLARMRLDPRLRGKISCSDVVQQTFQEALKDRESFRGSTDAELKSWLRKILIHDLLDAIQKKGNQERQIRDVVTQSSRRLSHLCVDGGPSPSQAAARSEDLERLEIAITRLGSDQQEAVSLRFFHDCSLAQTGGHMNRSVEAVAGLLHRALERLGELMK